VVAFLNRPPLNQFRNVWFRNNIFWKNSGGITIEEGVDPSGIYFANNLWEKPYAADARAYGGAPGFADPGASAPEMYKIERGSAAIDRGILLYENPVDFWGGSRPHGPEASKSRKYDLGAHQFEAAGTVRVGLDRSAFPFEVQPYKLQFKARPRR
jgi:hypothetical protein